MEDKEGIEGENKKPEFDPSKKERRVRCVGREEGKKKEANRVSYMHRSCEKTKSLHRAR